MFEATNLSSNTLQMSSGKNLAPGESVKLKQISDRERDYQDRGWLQITEEKKEGDKK